MSSILYIGNDYCHTLEQLQNFFHHISSDQDSLYNELLTLQRDGLIAQWLEEGTEKERTLAKQIKHLPTDLTNKELMEKMAEILTNRSTSYNVNICSYLELKDVSYALHESFPLLLKPIFKKISKGEVLNIEEEDLIGRTLQLQMTFKIIKPEKETFRLNALLSLQQKTTHKATTDLSLNNEPIGKEKVIRWNIPIHLLKKDDDSYLLEVKSGGQILFYAKLSLLGIPDVFTVNGVQFKMIKVDGGTFKMGALLNDSDAKKSEMPQHDVTLNKFYIGETVVTQALWHAVMNDYPSFFRGDELPVEQVSYDKIIRFISRLNGLLGNQLHGKKFALPTEEQWEFAARGGVKSNGYKYSGSKDINAVAWWQDCSARRSHSVKEENGKIPNELGIYGMTGNVWELCDSYWRKDYQTVSIDKFNLVIRGGSWSNIERYCRVTYRGYRSYDYCSNNLGFRLILQ